MAMNTEMVRQQMVAQQIRPWEVFNERVLTAFENVRREEFVPPALVNAAYADSEIPLPHGQYMLRPSIVGKIVQALEIESDDHVLEVGTGSAYLTACLAQLAGKVTSVDIFDDFVTAARQKLDDLEIDNVTLHCMDAMQELPDGQFDVVVVSGSTVDFEPRFSGALKPGGRLFCVIGESPVKTALLVRRGFEDITTTSELFETDIPPLLSTSARSAFSF